MSNICTCYVIVSSAPFFYSSYHVLIRVLLNEKKAYFLKGVLHTRLAMFSSLILCVLKLNCDLTVRSSPEALLVHLQQHTLTQYNSLHYTSERWGLCLMYLTVHQKLLCLCKVGSCLCLNSLKVSRYSWVITTTLLWVRGSCRPALDLMGLLWIRKKASALQVVI